MVFVERAIAEAGPVPRLLDTRGCVKLAQSRLRAANEDLLAATDAGGTPAAFLHFAWLQAESGDLIQAEETLAHAVEIGMRAGQLHPLDQDLLSRLRSQIRGVQDASDRRGIEL